MKRNVLSRKDLPTKLPFTQTLVVGFLLDYYNAPEWITTAIVIFYLIIWAACIYLIFNEKTTKLFAND